MVEDLNQFNNLQRGLVTVKATGVCEDCGKPFDAESINKIYSFIGGRNDSDYGRRKVRCYECREVELERQRVEQQEQAERWREETLQGYIHQAIPRRYHGVTLESFDAKGNEGNFKFVKQYFDEFPVVDEINKNVAPLGYRSLYICSKNRGVGKTHLATAGLKHVVARAMRLDNTTMLSLYRFREAVSLKQALRAGQSFSAEEKAEDIYYDLVRSWLLVLDDIGKEAVEGFDKSFVSEMYYRIINDRYNNDLPIVITSDLPLDKPWEAGGMTLRDLAGSAVVSRLREMTKGQFIELQGEDRR